MPPSNSDLLGSKSDVLLHATVVSNISHYLDLDPTKLKKGRQFSKGTNAAVSGPSDMSLWTETPAERQQRLEDEVMGRKRRAVDVANSGPSDDPEKKRRKREEAKMKREVEEYTVSAKQAAFAQRLTFLLCRGSSAVHLSSTNTAKPLRSRTSQKAHLRSGTIRGTWVWEAGSWTTTNETKCSAKPRAWATDSAAGNAAVSFERGTIAPPFFHSGTDRY